MTQPVFGRLSDPAASFVVVGARIVDPGTGTDRVGDLGVRDGRVVAAAQVPARAERIDARGLVLAPGLCDLHVHLREPGDGAAETIASGTRAAARGGFTTVCAMPNTVPAIADAATVTWVADAARDASSRVRAIGAVTAGRGGELADLRSMADAGAVGFSDDGTSVPSRALVAEALETLRPLERLLVEHAEDPQLAGGGVMRAGSTAVRLGLPGWPDAAEVSIVERDLALAAASGAALHITHLSREGSVDAVRRAKASGVRVTCDVTPHHLAFADTWVAGDRAFAWEEPRHDRLRAYDTACRVNPPLGSRRDAAALRAGLEDGTVDAIATDHAPHAAPAKLVPFEDAAPGLIGLETALSIGIAAVDAGVLRFTTLLAALSTRPAAIIGERRVLSAGEPADLVLFDPGARWRVEAGTLASRSANTPLLGMTLPGVVRLTAANGRVTYRASP